MIENHIIIRQPDGSTTFFGSLAHKIFFHAYEEFDALRRSLPAGRHVFAPQPKSGVIEAGEFRPDQWTVGPQIKTPAILPDDLVIDVEVET